MKMRKKFHATRNLRIICIAKNIKILESCTVSILLSFLYHDTVRFFHDIAQWRHASSYHHRVSARRYFWNKVCVTENFCLIMVITKICEVERKWPIMENFLKCMTISNGMRFTRWKGFFFFSVWGYNEKKMSSLRQFQPWPSAGRRILFSSEGPVASAAAELTQIYVPASKCLALFNNLF